MKLSIDIEATDGAARAGVVTTARGKFSTPVFMPVGTRGTVRAVTTADMERLGAEIILGNTYHLMLRPGADVVAALGGLHRFEDWSGHMLTDSGGYQIFSLEPKVDDEGATFTSTYDGSSHHVSPEEAVRIQELLGADIQMVLDVCTALPASRAQLRDAVDRTADWAGRARRAHGAADPTVRERQALFGIVQGGTEIDLRAESARRTVELDFDGYAVGGLSVGEGRDVMLPALESALEHLPTDQPRYFMGLGDPVGIIEAVARGIDMMDCVLPTRLARHGTLLTNSGKLNIRRAEFVRSDDPIDPTCGCEVCARYSRAYLRHLMVVSEPTAATLATIHNLAWLLEFMRRIREAIIAGHLDELRREVATTWG